MAASNSSAKPQPNARLETTPGAYPSTPSLAETHSPTIVSSQLSLSQAVYERRGEYTRSHEIKIKVGTWNVASITGTEKDIGGWFVEGKGISGSMSELAIGKENASSEHAGASSAATESVEAQEGRRSKKRSTLPKNDPGSLPGGEEIGIYVLGLQEIVDVSSTTEALRPYSDPNPPKRWKQAVSEALPRGYHLVAEQQLIGLYLLVYASSEIAPTISSVSTTSVGTGLMGYMGNKGAVTARIVLGETTRMVFVNCHLSAGVEKGCLERRNWDASQILSRTKFDPVYDGGGVMEEFGEVIGDEDFAFWFGDLNYRLEHIPGEDVRRLLLLHTLNEYGDSVPSKQKIEHELAHPEMPSFARNQQAAGQASEDDCSSTNAVRKESSHFSTASSTPLLDADKRDPSSDPASLQTTISSLLAHDQLYSQMRAGKAFHEGWREGPIVFLPTYKYDIGSVGMFDSSEKQRGPSWCDRILFRTRRDRLEYQERVKAEEQARKKDSELKLRGVVEEAANEAVLFDYDPETDGADHEDDEPGGIAVVNATTDNQAVLTKAGFQDKIHLDHYTSHQRVLSSDHKPLNAIFTLVYDAVVPELKAKVHHEVARDLDKAENEGRPHVTLVVDRQRDKDADHGYTNPASQSPEGVDFGDVKFDHLKSRSVTIANTGRVPATIGFVDRSTDDGQQTGICPPWLHIRFDRPSDNHNSDSSAPQVYTLDPGDAVNVDLTIHVTNPELVRRLSEGPDKIEDVLVLRIHNGRDYFLPLRGNWQQSAFGRSIEKLIRIPEGGVRRWQHQKPDGSNQSDHDRVKWSAPRELFRLTETIEELVERVVAEWGMRGEEEDPPWHSDKATGWPFEGYVTGDKERAFLRERTREGLDTDTPFASLFPPETGSLQRLEAVADTLVQFLYSLEDGIITESLWLQLEKAVLDREKAKISLTDEEERTLILDTFSSVPAHSVSFTFVTFMLSRIANELAPVQRTLKRQGTATSFNEMEAVKQPDDDSSTPRRKEVEEAYAAIFADAMTRLPASVTGKARKAGEARRKHIVAVFLQPGVTGES